MNCIRASFVRDGWGGGSGRSREKGRREKRGGEEGEGDGEEGVERWGGVMNTHQCK